MSMNPARRHVATATPEASLRFSGINVILGFAALLCLSLGYLLLSRGSHVVAPLLLALGYAILIPLAIIL